MKDKFKRFSWILIWLVERISVAYWAAAWVWSWAVPAANWERGYEAVGGEWALITVTFIFVFWLMGIFIRKEEKVYAAKMSALSQGTQNAGGH